MEWKQSTYELGFINNDGYDLLSTTLFKNEEGNLEVQKKDEFRNILKRMFLHIGEGFMKC